MFLPKGESIMSENRLTYIDNLRLLMIVFVVIQHIAVTYSGIGDWYYVEPEQIGVIQTVFFGFYQAFTQSYFMGFLFLIAGYFVPSSYDKKGTKKFIKDRLIRLGIPTIIYMLTIHPIIVFGLLGYRIGDNGSLGSYIKYIVTFHFITESGPLWFAFALLIFTIIYAAFRKFSSPKAVTKEKDLPSLPKVFALILLISICAFLIRIIQPIGTNIINMQLCYFAQYIILFIVGIKCKRNNWLKKLNYATGKPWLILAPSLGFVLFLIIMISGGALNDNIDAFYGGITWQSAAYALWESFVSVSMSIGLIAWFKEKHNKQSKLIKTMSDNAFSVYVFHAPIIVVLSLLFAPVSLIPIIKFIILTLIGIPICFLSVNFTIQKVPFLRKLFA